MQKQGIKQPQNMVEKWNLIIKMNSYCWHLEVDAHHVSTRGCLMRSQLLERLKCESKLEIAKE
jgi:hypothetical protein